MLPKTSSKKTIISAIKNSINLKKIILGDGLIIETINKITSEMEQAFRNNKKVLFCGNGGSAADAQHLAAELSGKFYLDRNPLFAEALHVNSSSLTAIANDYSYNQIFSRLLEAKGGIGDILIALSTSGNSQNVIYAIKTAYQKKMITIGLTGKKGGKVAKLCQYVIKVPSCDTARIQESHILIGHIICEIVEKKIYG